MGKTSRRSLVAMAIGLSLVHSIYAAEKAPSQKDIDQIRTELKLLKESYQAKIDELEERLAEAEQANEEVSDKTDNLAIELSQQGNQKAANTFNPGLGVILNGHALSSSKNRDFQIPGYQLSDETGPGAQGFELGESEVNLTANIDDKFYGSVTLAFGEGVEVEEAYLQTIALAQGFNLKAGRFFSNIGYLTSHHTHTDSFTERPLPYEAFLGGQYTDDGIQLSWIAPTQLFWETGFELYRGENFPAAGSAHQGQGVWTAFTHVGGDINASQSWRAGLSYLDAAVSDRQTPLGESFSGDSELWIADFIWKWAPEGNGSNHNAQIQGEWMGRKESGLFTDVNALTHIYDAHQEGWYLQGVYQFMPQWRVGLRYAQLSSNNLPSEFANTTLDNLNRDPKRTSLMLDWSNSEFSRFRLQYSQDKTQPESDDVLTLQYIAAFGAHGAHSF